MNEAWIKYTDRNTVAGVYNTEVAAKQDMITGDYLRVYPLGTVRFCADTVCYSNAMMHSTRCSEHSVLHRIGGN